MNDDSLFELTGLAHMDMAHNTLFAVPESTAETGIALMEQDFIFGLTGTPIETAGLCVGTSTLPLDFSTDASTAGRDLGDDSSLLTTSEDPQSAQLSIGAACILGSGVGVYETSSSEEIKGIIFLKNDRPNSYIEKNAARLHNAFYGKYDKTFTYPAIIAESPEGFETAFKIFGVHSLERAKETLDIWEAILEKYE